jgi:hypothetical protein
MKYLIGLITVSFLAGCGDKDSDDTGSDTANVSDTSASVE